jgi:fumarate hydratase class II
MPASTIEPFVTPAKFRTEHDSMGDVQVPANKYWGLREAALALKFLTDEQFTEWVNPANMVGSL